MPVAPPDSSKALLPFALGDAGGSLKQSQQFSSEAQEKAFEQLAQDCQEFAQACISTNRKGTGVIFLELVRVFETLAQNPGLVKPSLQSCSKLLKDATAALQQPK